MGCSSSQAAAGAASLPQDEGTAPERQTSPYSQKSDDSYYEEPATEAYEPPIGPESVTITPTEEGVLQHLMSGVVTETASRRIRLISDNRGALTDYYYLDSQIIGRGSYGSVTKAKSRETGAHRAIKSLSKERTSETRRRFRQEILIMKMVDHPNIMRLFETFEDKRLIYLVMELCTGGDLYKRLQQVKRFSEADCLGLMDQILRPVVYLHSQRMCHRDIKPENFLLLTEDHVRDNTLKLTDFGLACNLTGESMSTTVGTLLYSSPQVLSGQYSESCDVWSCGVMMYALLSGRHPFLGKNETEVVAGIKRGNYRFQGEVWNSVSEGAKDLVRSMLKYKEWERASAQRALRHPWLGPASSTGVAEASSPLLKPSLLLDLKEYCDQSLLRRAALQVLSQHLKEEDLKVFRRTFKALDPRGTGFFTLADLQASLRHPQFGKVRDALQQVVQELGGTNQEIGYTDFLAATLEARHYMQEGPCRAAFRVFDRDNDGYISHRELHAVLFGTDISQVAPVMQGSQSLEAQKIEELLRTADKDGDGMLNFLEFKAVLLVRR